MKFRRKSLQNSDGVKIMMMMIIITIIGKTALFEAQPSLKESARFV
jgi:hypothetical protein